MINKSAQRDIAQLKALCVRLDERSSFQSGFSVVRNDHLPEKPVRVAYLSGGASENSWREFRQLARQIVPLLVGLGVEIEIDEENVVTHLIRWAMESTQNFTEIVPRGDGTTTPITVPVDHPYRLVALAINMFLAAKPERTADSKTDNGKISLPDSPDVSDLCKQLQKELPRGRTQIEIALDFTGNKDKKAKSLLRQARRFRHLWK